MKQDQTTLCIPTQGQGLFEFTTEMNTWVRSVGITQGLLTVFCRHTSASLTVQENADPDVKFDMVECFKSLVPQSETKYRHANEGLDDMPAHIRTSLTDVSVSIPVQNGLPVLGMWQGMYVFEHRNHAHNREVVLHLIGT